MARQRCRFAVLLSSTTLLSALAAAQAPAPPAGPAAPAAPAAPGAPAAPVAPAPAAPGTAATSARADPREAVVKLERAGVELGLGSILVGDGRVLTALSPLGDGNHIVGRFADGSVVPLRVVHADRGWDLALLVPKLAGARRGVSPSRRPITEASGLSAYTSLGEQGLASAQVAFDSTATLLGGDGTALPGAILFKNTFRDTDIGSPILNQNNDVVALLARACLADKPPPCERIAYGVPVSAVRAFLKSVPPAPPPAEPWLGLRGAPAKGGPVQGVRVVEVAADGPAAAAGLQGASNGNAAEADIVVAFNDVAVTTPEALDALARRLEVGDTAHLLVYRSGKFRQASLTLRAAPASSAPRGPAQVPGPPERGPARPQQSN